MCKQSPVTESTVDRHEILGSQCPICCEPSPLDLMRFLDPHGVQRVDAGLFRCGLGLHNFAEDGGHARLISEKGRIVRNGRKFAIAAGGGWIEVS